MCICMLSFTNQYQDKSTSTRYCVVIRRFWLLGNLLWYLNLDSLQGSLWCALSCSLITSSSLWLIYPGDRWHTSSLIPSLTTYLLLSSKCQPYTGFQCSEMVRKLSTGSPMFFFRYYQIVYVEEIFDWCL